MRSHCVANKLVCVLTRCLVLRLFPGCFFSVIPVIKFGMCVRACYFRFRLGLHTPVSRFSFAEAWCLCGINVHVAGD